MSDAHNYQKQNDECSDVEGFVFLIKIMMTAQGSLRWFWLWFIFKGYYMFNLGGEKQALVGIS